jgi:hypothetical protein
MLQKQAFLSGHMLKQYYDNLHQACCLRLMHIKVILNLDKPSIFQLYIHSFETRPDPAGRPRTQPVWGWNQVGLKKK